MIWNPLDWTAGPFLALYVALAAIVLALGFALRTRIGPVAESARELTVLDLAYLAGGAKRLGDAALLCLTAARGATIDPKGHKISITDQSSLTRLLGRPISLAITPAMTRQQFQKAAKPLVEAVDRRLRQLGLSPSDDQMASLRLTVLPFLGLLMVFGGLKALIGSERGHPIGFLIALLVMTAISGVFLAKRPTRTRAGDEVLQSYRAKHARAARAPLEHELLLAVALSGAVVLSGTDYAPVYAASQTMNSSSDGGSGCGGGGGGGCGGCS